MKPPRSLRSLPPEERLSPLGRPCGAETSSPKQGRAADDPVAAAADPWAPGVTQPRNPRTGETAAPRVIVQRADFDLGAEVGALRAGDASVGAVCAFVGTVRDRNAGAAVSAMELEHYPGMTERAIEAMIDAALQRFEIRAARVIHRIGTLQPEDQIMMVAVSSTVRGQAFQACEFLMDYLKTQAPFWKKEDTCAGARWVDARSSDDAALARWGITASNAAIDVPASCQVLDLAEAPAVSEVSDTAADTAAGAAHASEAAKTADAPGTSRPVAR